MSTIQRLTAYALAHEAGTRPEPLPVVTTHDSRLAARTRFSRSAAQHNHTPRNRNRMRRVCQWAHSTRLCTMPWHRSVNTIRSVRFALHQRPDVLSLYPYQQTFIARVVYSDTPNAQRLAAEYSDRLCEVSTMTCVGVTYCKSGPARPRALSTYPSPVSHPPSSASGHCRLTTRRPTATRKPVVSSSLARCQYSEYLYSTNPDLAAAEFPKPSPDPAQPAAHFVFAVEALHSDQTGS